MKPTSRQLTLYAGLSLALLLALLIPASVQACGGLFCQNIPVDQNAERIIFTQNGDGTVSAIVQIQYTGSAPDFSWVLPIPSPITAEDIEVPEDAMAAFTELETSTNPVFIPPPFPDCAPIAMAAPEEEAFEDGGVEVFASGEVGPYGFDVVGSEDPTAMIVWLRDHDYRVTEEMEPLIQVYVEEQMVFLAMRLLPDQDVQDIEPIKITYETDRPMIPLRLTAVAANPDMAVIVWIYADVQAVPDNYAHMQIPDEDITFFDFGGNNYRQLMGEHADKFNGQAFVTEYAAPTANLPVGHPLLQQLAQDYRYVTRLNTVISPEEMTVDPTFRYDQSRPDVSNVHDLSDMTGLYECERLEAAAVDVIAPPPTDPPSPQPTNTDLPATEPQPGDTESEATESPLGIATPDEDRMFIGVMVFAGIAIAAVLIGVGIWLERRTRR